MKKIGGFTLIEVLIALAILGIAMTAIIKSTSQNIKDTYYVQQKTIANWVATKVISEARAGIIKLPNAPDEASEEIEMLGQQWVCKAQLAATPNPKIKEVKARVALKTNEDEPVLSLTGYYYVQ